MSISSKLNPLNIKFVNPIDDNSVLNTEVLDGVEPIEFVDMVMSGNGGGSSSMHGGGSSLSGLSSSMSGPMHGGGMAGSMPTQAVRSNLLNITSELKACKQLLRVQSYMSSSLSLQSLISKILDSAHYILNADRVTLYLVNHMHQTLECVHSKDNISGIKIPIGTGIAGSVAISGKLLNIPDAYKDTRFYPGVDRQTGYRTKGVLCAPIKFAGEEKVEAVIQAINKLGASSGIQRSVQHSFGNSDQEFCSFTETDESMLVYLANEAAICLKNARMLEQQVQNAKKAAMMTKLLTVFTAELDVKKAVGNIVECATDILDADRVSLFLVDNDDLVCNFSKDVVGFRFDKTKGVAGQVITTGKILNVEDAYDFAHFNQEVDKKSGYITKSILCGPVLNANGETIAVIQAVNKRSGNYVFTQEDEALLVGLTGQAGIGLQNAQLYDGERYQRALNATLLDVATAVSSELDSHTMFQTIMNSARSLMQCDRCSLFLVDHDTQEFWSFVTESSGVEFRFPVTKGVIGESFKNSEPLNIPDAYKHPTFNAEIDAQSGYRTQSIMCVPIKTADGFVVGIIEMINKFDSLFNAEQQKIHPRYAAFTEQDQTVLLSFTEVIAGALANSLIFNELEAHTSVVESTLQGITSYIITLDNHGRLKTSNHDLQELFGSSLNDMRTTSYTEWLGTVGNESFKRNIQQVYDTKAQVNVKNEVLAVHAKAGSSLTVNYNIVPLRVEKKRMRFTRRGSELMRRGSTMVTDNGEASARVQTMSINEEELSALSSSPGRLRKESVDSSHGSEPDSPMDYDQGEMQGVVIVLENITEGRLRMTAIQRYQRRLNEMENQVKEFSDLRSKLRSLEIEDLKEIKPETTKQLAKLALCLNDNATTSTAGYDSIRDKMDTYNSSNGSPPLTMYGSSGSPSSKGFLVEYRSVLSAKSLKTWDWNVLAINEPAVLNRAVSVMFEELQLMEQWAIPSNKLDFFIENVASKYREVPFHNFKHGVAVMHISFYLIACTDAGMCLNAIQAFALIVSALCHDIDHPGHTNAFEVNSGSELALFYNDNAVLENHHCATASILLKQEGCNILVGLDKGEFKEFRSVMCSAILATDMSSHFNLLSKFRDSVHSSGGWNPEQSSDKLLLLSILLHAADLSNPTRPWEASRTWAGLVSQEFNAQVASEKSLDLPFLPFMETADEDAQAKQETSFIEFIIEPMWKDVVEFLPQLSFIHENIAANKSNWKAISRRSTPRHSAQVTPSASVKSLQRNNVSRGSSSPISTGSKEASKSRDMMKGRGNSEGRSSDGRDDLDDLSFASGDNIQ
jgi:GAF domain-containing protein